MQLQTLVDWLDNTLDVAGISDFNGAHNGLQLVNTGGQVAKVALAVDASLGVVEEAVAQGCNLLLVHHGMFWRGVSSISGALFKKLQLAMQNDLAIYSVHLPLDVHARYGNNARLAQVLGFEQWSPCLDYKGRGLGILVELPSPMPYEELLAKVQKHVNPHTLAYGYGAKMLQRLVICSGGAGSEIERVRALADTFITGEGSHWNVPLAEELGMNLLLAGHYATEVFGVQALGEELQRSFGLQCVFIDRPSGL